MDGRKRVFLGEEAAVDDLAKGCFWDKFKTINDLFKIHNPSQNTPKPPPKRAKKRGEEKFSFW